MAWGGLGSFHVNNQLVVGMCEDHSIGEKGDRLQNERKSGDKWWVPHYKWEKSGVTGDELERKA